MSKFREIDLTTNLKEFEKITNIELKYERGIDGVILLENATVKYDFINGFINIKGKNADFKINTTLVEKYEKVEDTIEITMESFIIKIRKI